MIARVSRPGKTTSFISFSLHGLSVINRATQLFHSGHSINLIQLIRHFAFTASCFLDSFNAEINIFLRFRFIVKAKDF